MLYKIKHIPLIPLRGMSVFPHMVIHFDVGREKSLNALEKAMVNDSLILLCTQKDAKVEDPYFRRILSCRNYCKDKANVKTTWRKYKSIS